MSTIGPGSEALVSIDSNLLGIASTPYRTVIAPSQDLERLSPADGLCLADCRSHAPVFAGMVVAAASRHYVPSRALSVRALLQLPRLARTDGVVSRRRVIAELNHCAARLRHDQQSLSELIPRDEYGLSDLRFVGLESAVADRIFGRLHYLRSARAGSMNFALVDPLNRLPVTLCSVSPLEWKRVGRQLRTQFGIPLEGAWDVSRVYSFDVAPANAISYLLGRVRQWIRRELPTAQVLTTAVDPNLGFTGSSYRSANWQKWMSIAARPYLYVDGLYATPRQLRARFGDANLSHLRATHSEHRFEQSRARLLNSAIFCSRLRGETEQVAPADCRVLRR
ncbi:hypothetical protein [Kribbella sp. HUAS MG21]|uniref:Uncharacterized protein n=1 Tax=Kribbella sp. HUAS MG21 TaxID=3160966 RepID=A0AAU7TB38_9ACTN